MKKYLVFYVFTVCSYFVISPYIWAQDKDKNISIEQSEEETSLLRLEELIADTGQVELDLSFSLSSKSNDGVASVFDTFTLEDGQVVSILTSLDQPEVETDTALIAGALRFGVAANTELSIRAAFVGNDTRVVENGMLVDTDRAFALNQFSLGFSYQFSEDNDTPALIGYADLALAEALDPDGKEFAFAKTLNAGVRTYRILDPIALTLSAGYRISTDRSIDDTTIDPGDTLYILPGVVFAVNDIVTLTGSINLSRLFADSIDGQDIGADRTRAEPEFGLGFGLSQNKTLRAAARFDAVGDNGFTGIVAMQHKFKN